MRKIRNLMLVVPFCFALVAPLAVVASPYQDHRYYDEDHKDYHEWNKAEQRYYRDYWRAQHRHYTAWDRANEEQRRDYWRWRHDHDRDHDHDYDRH